MAKTHEVVFQDKDDIMPEVLKEKIRKRIPKDIKSFLENPNFPSFLKDPNNMFVIWTELDIKKGHFAGQRHILEFNLRYKSYEYPFTAPYVRFLTPMYHMNVGYEGDICASILKYKSSKNPLGWTPICNLIGVMTSLIPFLSIPGEDSPWNIEAYEDWKKCGGDPDLYSKCSSQYYQKNLNTSILKQFDEIRKRDSE